MWSLSALNSRVLNNQGLRVSIVWIKLKGNNLKTNVSKMTTTTATKNTGLAKSMTHCIALSILSCRSCVGQLLFSWGCEWNLSKLHQQSAWTHKGGPWRSHTLRRRERKHYHRHHAITTSQSFSVSVVFVQLLAALQLKMVRQQCLKRERSHPVTHSTRDSLSADHREKTMRCQVKHGALCSWHEMFLIKSCRTVLTLFLLQVINT